MATLEAGSRVADLGGGTGTLIDFGHRTRSDLSYICIDPATGMLKHAAAYASRVAARGEQLPFRDRTFGAVMIGDAVHHFSDPVTAIEEVARTIEPGGALFIFDLNPETVAGRLTAAFERLSGEPTNFFSPGKLENLLTKKGFVISKTSHGWRYTVEARRNA